MSRLARANPNILYILQDDAKDNADNKEYIAVFVASEGVIPKMMMRKYKFLFLLSKEIFDLRIVILISS